MTILKSTAYTLKVGECNIQDPRTEEDNNGKSGETQKVWYLLNSYVISVESSVLTNGPCDARCSHWGKLGEACVKTLSFITTTFLYIYIIISKQNIF